MRNASSSVTLPYLEAEEASLLSVLTVTSAIIITAHFLAEPLCPLLGLPPPAVIVRTVRPYIKYITLTAWILIRVVHPLIKRCGNGNHSGVIVDIVACNGLLNSLCTIYSNFSIYLLSFASTSVFRRFLSTMLLFLNDLLGFFFIQTVFSRIESLRRVTFSELKEEFLQRSFEFSAAHVGIVQKQMQKEELKMETDMKEGLKDKDRKLTTLLPKVGRNPTQVLADLQKKASKENSRWERGLVSGAVYSGEAAHTALQSAVYAAYSLSNPLHTDIWPTINQCEAEVVSMTAGLLNGGDENVVGATSSGGTESIILAVRAHLIHFGRKRSITRPEVICCTTAHVALDKACEMFHVRLIRVKSNPDTFLLPPEDVERHVTSNTVMIYASAPSFPQGVIDPIESISAIALKYSIGLHVDACLGGFVLPFARQLGYPIPKFDFGCPGVTSMSCDTHKYAYASKGTSVVLYRNKHLRRCQYFAFAKWSGGLYSTPTIAGSRPGALLACAWASLVTIGESGYQSRVKFIMDTTQRIANAVSQTPGLYLLGGRPHAMVVCFGSREFDIYIVGDAMAAKGWSLNFLQYPASIHICVTLKTVENAEKFIADLRMVVEDVHRRGEVGKTSGSAAIYGMAGSMPAGPVNELLKVYTDVTLTP